MNLYQVVVKGAENATRELKVVAGSVEEALTKAKAVLAEGEAVTSVSQGDATGLVL